MGELQLCLDQDYQNTSYVTRYVAPGDGELINFQPGSGIAMSYDDLKVIKAHRLVQSIATGQSVGATIHDALKAAENRCDGRVRCETPGSRLIGQGGAIPALTAHLRRRPLSARGSKLELILGMRTVERRRRLLLALGAIGVAALVIGAGLFQPWRLFVDERGMICCRPRFSFHRAPSSRLTPFQASQRQRSRLPNPRSSAAAG